tara:strand:+ start:185 stop:1042 length:858 start_codon:yes stop_codon:yes gene_type:complete
MGQNGPRKRYTDICNHYIQHIINNNLLINNPKWNDGVDDYKKYYEIWGVHSQNCHISGNVLTRGSMGDHIFAVREYFKDTGRCGLNTQFNRIMVESRYNKTWKKISFQNKVTDIGLIDLKELNYLVTNNLDQIIENKLFSIKQQQDFCMKMLEWRKYVKKRGVKVSTILPKECILFLDIFKQQMIISDSLCHMVATNTIGCSHLLSLYWETIRSANEKLKLNLHIDKDNNNNKDSKSNSILTQTMVNDGWEVITTYRKNGHKDSIYKNKKLQLRYRSFIRLMKDY